MGPGRFKDYLKNSKNLDLRSFFDIFLGKNIKAIYLRERTKALLPILDN
jgi:hypothetical protein